METDAKRDLLKRPWLFLHFSLAALPVQISKNKYIYIFLHYFYLNDLNKKVNIQFAKCISEGGWEEGEKSQEENGGGGR